MTSLQMQAYFELEIAEIDLVEKPNSEDIFYFLNQAINRFVKTRYSGINYKGDSFEQTQKRSDDLRTLVKEVAISTTQNTGIVVRPNSYTAILPTDYFTTVSEEVRISFTGLNGNSKLVRTGITECTLDTYTFKVSDPLEMHNLHMDCAWPLRLYVDGKVILVSDGSYTISYYFLTYLKLPTKISVGTNCDLPEHTHQEIVKLAVDMFLENISNQRVQTYPNQVNTME